jgi:hypothetical protein
MPSPDPDLVGICAAMNRAGARYVVIGGFAVIAAGFVRATEDVDLLIPADAGSTPALRAAVDDLGAVFVEGRRPVSDDDLAHRAHLRLLTAASGIVDLVREGAPPLDFATVAADARHVVYEDVPIVLAGLRSLVAFKRLAGRAQDRADLQKLEELHGPLPIVAVPGLDDA